MALEDKPLGALAASVLPGPLYRALRHIFAQGVRDCTLVGGTALAGYYAGHRRSDDLDLFVRDDKAHRATRLAIASLQEIGADLQVDQSTAQYHAVTASLEQHAFTAQVVLDPQIYTFDDEIGSAEDGVAVASLELLLRLKGATLVSRASEKDIYDLIWLFEHRPKLTLKQLVALGRSIDAGVTAENMLLVLCGTTHRESACDFVLDQTGAAAFAQITAFKEQMMQGLDGLARGEPAPALGELIRALKP